MALTDKLTNIADAIREKTGSTRTMNLEEMAAAVTNIKIPTALSDLNEDETHRTVTDAEKKTWNDKSDFSGNYDDLKNKQLAGTTDELTPTQVYAAVSTGKPVKVQYTDRTYGALFFTAFNVAESLNVIVSQTIVYVNGVYILAELNGNKSDNTWGFNTTTLAQKADIPDAVDLALAQAKASGEFDGADGLTPTIGENGNWYLGDADTGKPSRGDKGDKGDKGDTGETGATGATGADGKSAYEYAQDGGYTGTEAEFAEKLAQEMPTALPNPNALTFTGAVTGSYDGSEPVTLEIPSGGSGSSDAWNLIEHITAEDAAISYEIPLQPGAKEYGIYWEYTQPDGAAVPRRDISVDESLAQWGVMYRCLTNEPLFVRVHKGPSSILVTAQGILYSAHRFSNGGTYIGSGTDFPAMTLKTNIACTTSEIWVYWR